MIETKRKNIGGSEWSCTQFTGTKSLDVLFSLSSTLGPTLSGLSLGDGGNLMASDVDLGAMIEKLVRNIGDSSDFEKLVFKLIASCHVDGRPAANRDVFDTVFAGPGILNLGKVLLFVAETNYGDFSGAVASIMRATASPEGAVGQSQESSTPK